MADNKKTTKRDIRSIKYMHWWTFFGLYLEIGESLFSTVVSIRDKNQQTNKQKNSTKTKP